MVLTPTKPVRAGKLQQLARNDSDSAQQNQNQQDNNYEAQSTAAVVAGPIKWAAANATKATQQGNHQNNQDDRTDRHGLSPFRMCARLER